MTDEIEDRLKEALAPVAPPKGFADRVIAIAESQTREADDEVDSPSHWRRVWWAAAAAAILALVPTLYLTMPTQSPEETRIVGPTSEDVPLVPPDAIPVPPIAAPPVVTVDPAPAPRPKSHAAPRQQKQRDAELYAEALEAKEKLVRALAITGNAMERVQQTVDPEPEKVPTSVRKNKRPESRS